MYPVLKFHTLKYHIPQVKPIHATLHHNTPTPSKLARGHSPDSDEGPTAPKREKHVWRPY